jgi:hypothetical protein
MFSSLPISSDVISLLSNFSDFLVTDVEDVDKVLTCIVFGIWTPSRIIDEQDWALYKLDEIRPEDLNNPESG